MAFSQKMIKRRLLFLLLFSLTMSILLLGRVFWIQFVKGDELKTRAQGQWARDVPVEPKRGTIFDRNNNPLAISATVDTIIASPPDIEDVEKTAKLLALVLELDEDQLAALINKAKNDKTASIYIKRKVSDEESQSVRDLHLKGVYFTNEYRRFYPERNLLSHVLGFTGIDSQGLDGVEWVYDKYLKGFPGRIVSETDSFSRKLPFGVDKYIPPKDGYNIYLTIDKVIQHISERELEKAMKELNAKKGTVIVMDPRNGEILSLVNKPDYDPNDYIDYPQELWRNIAVSDVYEPGSTFKFVPASAALEEGTSHPEDRFFDPGFVTVAGIKIRCWHTEGHGSQSFVQIVENSCNPCFVELVSKLGKEKYIKYIKGFGFGETTGIDLPGEAKGIFDTSTMGPVETATMSFGQGISVTPIQLITAFSAVINDGKMVRPHVVKAIVDDNENVIYEPPNSPIRQVVSFETAQEMKSILESVVTNGTGGRGKIEGYRVGGKTGTAEKYVEGKYVASFEGFAPVEAPRLAALVILDEPEGTVYGGQMAGPVFQKIMEDSLNYLGIMPQLETQEDDKQVKVPDVRNLYVEDAKKILGHGSFMFKMEGIGYVVTSQVPAPGMIVSKNTTVILKLSDSITTRDPVTVPNLLGRTVKETIDILNAIGLDIEISGSGFVVNQVPLPEVEVGLGTQVKVEFSKDHR